MITSPAVSDKLDRERYKRFRDHDFDADTKFQKGWEKISSRYRGDNLEAEHLEAKICYYSREYEEVTIDGYNHWLQADRNREQEITDRNDVACASTTETIKIPYKGDNSNNVESAASLKEKDSADRNRENEITDRNDAACASTTETFKISSKGVDSCASTTETFKITSKGDNYNNVESAASLKEKYSPDNDRNSKNCDDTTKKDSLSFMEIAEMIENGIKLPSVEDLNIEPTNTKPTPSSINRKKKPWEL